VSVSSGSRTPALAVSSNEDATGAGNSGIDTVNAAATASWTVGEQQQLEDAMRAVLADAAAKSMKASEVCFGRTSMFGLLECGPVCVVFCFVAGVEFGHVVCVCVLQCSSG